jgi:hypothetical protein
MQAPTIKPVSLVMEASRMKRRAFPNFCLTQYAIALTVKRRSGISKYM